MKPNYRLLWDFVSATLNGQRDSLGLSMKSMCRVWYQKAYYLVAKIIGKLCYDKYFFYKFDELSLK